MDAKSMRQPSFLSILSFLLVLATASGQAADDMKAFPPAEAGTVRYVLQLPPLADESVRRVELIVGKTVETDPQNRYFFTGRIEAQTIEGWGFTRYVVKDLGVMAGTRMGVDPKAPKVARFIPLGGEPYIIRYNSHLPIVIYLPEGAEVRYRIWAAADGIKAISKG
jgi:ecotin